jgi:hypothetical protein
MNKRRLKPYKAPLYKGLEHQVHLTEVEKRCMQLRMWISDLEWLAFWESLPDGAGWDVAVVIRAMGRFNTVKYPPRHELINALEYHRKELEEAESFARRAERDSRPFARSQRNGIMVGNKDRNTKMPNKRRHYGWRSVF